MHTPQPPTTYVSHARLSWSERVGVWPLTLLPHHALSRLMLAATRIRFKLWKNWQIRWFIRRYRVDLGVADVSDPTAYPCFNAFFTRALKPNARTIDSDPHTVACPVDGTVSSMGMVYERTLLQAKGHPYELGALLAREPLWTPRFAGGQYITLYLAPRDYHRVHMPITGRLSRSIYVPGRLFPVKPQTVERLDNLFARNERIISFFETAAGPMAMVMVGALFVGTMEVVWRRAMRRPLWVPRDFGPEATVQGPVLLTKGSEMGRFNMGSTVILLFPAGAIRWSAELWPEARVTMGQAIGTLL